MLKKVLFIGTLVVSLLAGATSFAIDEGETGVPENVQTKGSGDVSIPEVGTASGTLLNVYRVKGITVALVKTSSKKVMVFGTKEGSTADKALKQVKKGDQIKVVYDKMNAKVITKGAKAYPIIKVTAPIRNDAHIL